MRRSDYIIDSKGRIRAKLGLYAAFVGQPSVRSFPRALPVDLSYALYHLKKPCPA